MLLKSMAEEWQSVLDELMPPEAGDVQRAEMKKAFYLGASCMLDRCHDATGLSEDQGCEALQELSDEVNDFFEQLVIDFVAGHEV